MTFWFQLAQLAFALFVAVVIAERVRLLCYRAPVSDATLRRLVDALKRGNTQLLRAWLAARSESYAARVIALRLGADIDATTASELVSELREEATARLLVIRVSATLASTTGLLGGILTLATGPGEGAGLLALQAGAAERQNLTQAITTMAIGVALSALCFQALALLKPAARQVIAQVDQLARAMGDAGP